MSPRVICNAFLAFLIPSLMVPASHAEIHISNLEVEAVISNQFIVRYSWKMTVSFNEDRSTNCELKITFFDAHGSNIHSKTRFISLSQGTNELAGHGVCRPEVWRKLKEYKAHIKCP